MQRSRRWWVLQCFSKAQRERRKSGGVECLWVKGCSGVEEEEEEVVVVVVVVVGSGVVGE